MPTRIARRSRLTAWRIRRAGLAAAWLQAAWLSAVACAPADAGTDTAQDRTGEIVEVERLGLRFARPDSFLVSRFAPETLPPEAVEAGLEPPFAAAVVLVEPGVLERSGFHLDSIPVGEIPVIWIDRSDLTAALVGSIVPSETTFTVGAGVVNRFAGYPGPYGDQVHFYLLDLGDGRPIEIGAHRYRFREADPPPPSGYDRVIERILPSIRVLRK